VLASVDFPFRENFGDLILTSIFQAFWYGACLGVAGFHFEICPFLPLFFSLKIAAASFIRLMIGAD
jgi:hypothetical protein